MRRYKHGEGLYFESEVELNVVTAALQSARIDEELQDTHANLLKFFEEIQLQRSNLPESTYRGGISMIGQEEMVALDAIKQFSQTHFDYTVGMLAGEMIDDFSAWETNRLNKEC